MKRFRNLKLFPKTFFYLLLLFGTVILMMQFMLYFFLPKMYLDEVHRELDSGLDSLCSAVTAIPWADCGSVFEQYVADNGVNLVVESGAEKQSYQGMPIQIELNRDEAEPDRQFQLSGVEGMEAILIKNRTVTSRDGRPIHIEMSASTQPVRQTARVIVYLLPGVSLAAVAVSVLCAYFYSGKLTRPIRRMLRETRHMEALERDAAIPVESGDELGMLAEEINRLYRRLWQTIHSLEQEKEHIAEMERLKVDFLRSASHELKTPLAGLRILLENMRYNIGKYKDHDTYLENGMEQIDRLTVMIRDILDASRFPGESGAVQSLCVSDEVAEIWQEYELLAKAGDLSAEIDICPELKVEMEPTQFRRVCSNLISNAVRYTPAGGHIRIFGSDAVLSVRNTCTPLTEEQSRRVFDAFYRPDFARSANEGGSGLGLYLVREILESGNLPYSFVPDGEGMCFTIGLRPGIGSRDDVSRQTDEKNRRNP